MRYCQQVARESSTVSQQIRPDTTVEVIALVRRARQLELQDTTIYLDVARRAVEIGRTYATAEAMLQARIELANALRINGRVPEAIEMLQAAVNEAEQLVGPDRAEIAGQAHFRLAVAYHALKDDSSSIEHVRHAEAYATEAGDTVARGRLHNMLAIIYSRNGKHSEAIEHLLQAIQDLEHSGDRDRRASSWSNLSAAMYHLGRNEEALDAAEKALELATATIYRATAYNNKALALMDLGRLQEAEENFLLSREQILQHGDPNYQSEHGRYFALLMERSGRLDEAVRLAREARDIAVKHNLLQAQLDANHDIYRLEKLGGNPAAALEALEEHVRLSAQAHLAETERLVEREKWRSRVQRMQEEAAAERRRRENLASSYQQLTQIHERLSERARELEWHSYRDSLTELANRRYFDERLAAESERSRETGESLGMFMIDVDTFKTVNDSHGHPVGDELLRQIARLLQASVRRMDVVARLGGDEMGVLLLAPGSLADRIQLAEQIRSRIANQDWGRLAPGLNVTVSLGGAVLSEVGGDPVKLLSLADRRLYQAKTQGRDRAILRGR